MSDLAIIGTYSVFIASYVVFALGKFPGMKIDRPGAAIIGAVLMFMTGAVRANTALHLIHFGLCHQDHIAGDLGRSAGHDSEGAGHGVRGDKPVELAAALVNWLR